MVSIMLLNGIYNSRICRLCSFHIECNRSMPLYTFCKIYTDSKQERLQLSVVKLNLEK